MIGIIGGMGPLATVDFMAKVLEETGAERDEDNVPMLASCDPRIPSRPAAILAGGESPLPALLDIRDRLVAAGATALAMPCNTAHYWHPALAADCPVPFPSIVEAGSEEAARQVPRSSAVGLLGTRATLAARLFDPVLARHGLTALHPTNDELDAWVLPAIAAVKAGQVAGAGPLLAQALSAMAARGARSVIMACTELPLALAGMAGVAPLACIDPTRALAREIVAQWRDGRLTGR